MKLLVDCTVSELLNVSDRILRLF